jgi:hypothetical protein
MTAPSCDDNVATTALCPVCGTAFRPVRRQRYCTQACRQAAYRARNPDPPADTTIAIAARTQRRDITVYLCADCDQRYLGAQWCHDCQRPCTRVGLGGSCPHCDQPVAVDDIIGQHGAHIKITNYAQPQFPKEAGSQ